MKTYKQFVQHDATTNNIDEGLMFGVAIERKLKAVLRDVRATDDVGDKIDLLMKGLHFSLGGMAYELHKTRK
jgi:hypothetical protein